MKKIIFIAAVSFFSPFAIAQTESLDGNNLGITVSDKGLFLAQPDELIYGFDLQSPGCEFPKGSGKHVMNGLAMWFGGVNDYHELRISTPTSTHFEEQFSGPLSIESLSGQYSEPKSFFKVTREEIDYHVTNYQQPNYEGIPSIMEWPAHGDVSYGFDFYLAPFVDVDGDGYYNPMTGDYPCIKGDEAVYMILNDKEAHAHCGGASNQDAMGIEIHYLFYQYLSIQELANTTFCEARVINRSATNYRDFTASLFMNASIGNPQDDFFGTDEERNLIYGYNGEAFDLRYGDVPPSVGVISLNKNINRSRVFGQYHNSLFPSSLPEFWKAMRGKLLTGDNYPKRFEYPGDPVLTEGDIQTLPQQANSMIYSIDVGDLASGNEVKFDFAIVAEQGGTNLNSVQNLRESVDYVQHFYDQSEGLCIQAEVGIPEEILPTESQENVGAKIVPNPSNGEFRVQLDEGWLGADVSVFNASGVLLTTAKNIGQIQTQLKISGVPGVYIVSIEKDGASEVLKAVVE
ncbi:MAG: T9SS type A sorting domain-containing protein [Crocinitomicaceae bacterium]